MCSFLFARTREPLSDGAIAEANRFARFRGPDATRIHRSRDPDGWCLTFVHNLLDISGTAAGQPRIDRNDGGELILLFNGEIYNHREIHEGDSDTDCLLPGYRKWGSALGRRLDGEFAILLHDPGVRRVTLFTDPFLTKPVHVAGDPADGALGIATCASSLGSLGFKDVRAAEPNAVEAFTLFDTGFVSDLRHPALPFDLQQNKDTYDDWMEAFDAAVVKRAQHGARFPAVYLSSGYDSGAICTALNRAGIPYDTFSITAGENLGLLEQRIRINKAHACRNAHLFPGLDAALIREMSEDIEQNVEPFRYVHEDQPGLTLSIRSDGGAVGANFIAREARALGRLVNLSGSGADEILSDYGFGGKKFYHHSQFGGQFPEQLDGFFPWRKFYGDTQRSYLFKDEFILGRSGIEGRYPFLDRALVQEFLRLTPELKNAAYKAPLDAYLRQHGYPFEPMMKRGFIPFLAHATEDHAPARRQPGRFRRLVRHLLGR